MRNSYTRRLRSGLRSTTSTRRSVAPQRWMPTSSDRRTATRPVTQAERRTASYGCAIRMATFTSHVVPSPPRADASIIFGSGVSSAPPGSLGGLLLAVSDIDAARADLVARGVDVSEVFHGTDAVFGSAERKIGPAPEHADYESFVSFGDPDGNGWLLQEVRPRLPGRGTGANFARVGDLAAALRDAAEAHGEHEAHNGGEYGDDWPEWYAAYMVAEQIGTELPA